MRQTVRRHGRDNRIFGSDPIPPGKWIYVGAPGDPGVTDDSPPFLNDWENVGGGLQRLRFRLNNEDQLEIQGAVQNGTAPVVCTLPDLDAHFRTSVFWPAEDRTEVGTVGADGLAVWSLSATGELSVVEAATGAGGIVFDEPNAGGSLEITITNSFEITAGASSFIDMTGNSLNFYDIGSWTIEAVDVFTTADTVGFQVDNLQVTLNAAGYFQLNDSTSAPIFKVDEDGTVHMKAGASILYDL